MKNVKYGLIFSAFLLMIVFSFQNCKDFGSPEFTITVVLEDGCTGTPDEGIYTYNEFDVVNYEYFPPEENIKVEVLLNGSARASSGQFIMYNNVYVTVRVRDIRGTWEFTYYLTDGSETTMDITFTGNTPFEGTFTDSRGYSGTWTVNNDDLTMAYADWYDYVFTGSITSMSGDYIGEGIQLGWSAVRKD